jgi:KipI family sensor histidine kinase inhibitor
MNLTPLGDQAILAHFATEPAAVAFAETMRSASWPEVIDIVPAYASVAVFFDLARIRHAEILARIKTLGINHSSAASIGCLHDIPCCYDRGPDLAHVAEQLRLSTTEVANLHSGTDYTIYAIGFCPGFPYLGYLPEALCGLARLATPRVRVPRGSVGLTGRQTGIYPLVRPGGWNLIGQTPFELVDVETGYFPLRVGDRIRFRPIPSSEFDRLLGTRLAVS